MPEEGDLSLTVEASLTGQATASQTYALRFERRDAQISVTEPEGGVVQQTKFYMRGVTEPNATVYVKGEGVSTNVKANARGVFSVPMNMEKVFSDEILSFGEGDVLTISVTVEGTSVDYDGQLLPAVRLWFYNE